MNYFIVFLCVMMQFHVEAAWSAKAETEQDVVIKKENPEDLNESRPRSVIGVPISCQYSEGTLCFQFWDDLGCVEIVVENQQTGTTCTIACDTSNGCILMQVPTDGGSYRLQIITECGNIYYGTYTL